MNKFWTILGHTYFSRLKSKAFIITTIILLLFIIGVANIQSIINLFAGEDEKEQVIVIDESNAFLTALESAIDQVDENIDLISYDESEEIGKDAVQEEFYDGLLILRSDEDDLPIATY